jgi:hypothetical protein
MAARSEVAFNLTYEELLTRQLSVYHHTISVTPREVLMFIAHLIALWQLLTS